MLLRVGRWELEHDPATTAECYAAHVITNPCDCTECQNFRAASDRAFPHSFRHLASLLGIDLAKPAELCHYGNPGDDCPTGGWFHFVGNLREGSDAWKQVGQASWVGDLERYLGKSELGFSNSIALLPDSFQGHPVVQLEFHVTVPWVLGHSVGY